MILMLLAALLGNGAFGPATVAENARALMLMMLALLGKCKGHDADVAGGAVGNGRGTTADAAGFGIWRPSFR